MTNFWRTLVLLVVGLGAGWAASRIGGGPPSVGSALDDTAAGAAESTEPADAPPAEMAETAPADAAGAPLPESQAPTEAEVEDEIRRAEEAIRERGDSNEELPVDPLWADVPIPLPSDI